MALGAVLSTVKVKAADCGLTLPALSTICVEPVYVPSLTLTKLMDVWPTTTSASVNTREAKTCPPTITWTVSPATTAVPSMAVALNDTIPVKLFLDVMLSALDVPVSSAAIKSIWVGTPGAVASIASL